jgi:hypothetical protein
MIKKATKKYSPEQVKVSNMLIDYAKPLLDAAPDLKAKEEVMFVAAFVWNATLKSKHKGEQMLADIRKSLSGRKDNLGNTSTIKLLIDRKTTLYPDEKQFIVDFEVSRADNGIFITADFEDIQ